MRAATMRARFRVPSSLAPGPWLLMRDATLMRADPLMRGISHRLPALCRIVKDPLRAAATACQIGSPPRRQLGRCNCRANLICLYSSRRRPFPASFTLQMPLPPDHAERLDGARLALDGLSVGDAFGQQFFAELQVEIATRRLPLP